jgi:integrase
MPALFKRSNGVYYAILTDGDGRRRWTSTGERTKSLALKHLIDLRQKSDDTRRRLMFKEFVQEFLEYARGVFSVETVGIYERSFRSLTRHVGNLRLDALTQKHVDLFKARRLTEVGRTTVNLELRSLRAALYTAMRWKFITENPLKGVKLCSIDEDMPAYLQRADFVKLLSSIPDGVYRDLYSVAALTGLRRGELINLRWEDVDLERQSIMIRSHGEFRTKGGRKRMVPMHQEVLAVLARRLSSQCGEYVFHAAGRRLNPSVVSIRFKRYLRRAGLDERLHLHSLRHTFASWLVQNEASLYQVQKLLGHSSIRVTERYSHLVPENLRTTLNKISIVLN